MEFVSELFVFVQRFTVLVMGRQRQLIWVFELSNDGWSLEVIFISPFQWFLLTGHDLSSSWLLLTSLLFSLTPLIGNLLVLPYLSSLTPESCSFLPDSKLIIQGFRKILNVISLDSNFVFCERISKLIWTCWWLWSVLV